MTTKLFATFAATILFASLGSAAIAVGPTSDAIHRETYQNPILDDGSMADPHVLLFNGKYYMYPTSHTHGYDVFVSDDLVRWENQATVFHDPRGGAWAPDVFHPRGADDKIYLYYTDNLPDSHSLLDKQIGVAISESPLGPFTDQKVLVRNAIDAHVYEDTDGKLYFYYVSLPGGFRIMVQPMADPLTPQGKAIEVIRPTEPWEQVSGQVTEGPFLIKRGNTYYLTYSGTGADSPNYGIGYATSKSPTGPFTKYVGNPIVQRTDAIHGPGHHSIVTGPKGDLWMVYHQKRNTRTNFDRFLAIDRMWFDAAGLLHAKATKETDEPAP